MNHDVFIEALSTACPWLMLVLCLQRVAAWRGLPLRRWGLLLLPGAIAAGVLLLPIGGIAVARWITGLNANFSIPLTGLLAVAVWERAFARSLFARQDWSAGWTFGAIGGLSLYPLALGVGSFDPYEWGWRFSPLFVVIAVLTGWLIWKKNRFGLLLLLAIAAFHLRLLESSNYWDYLLDPVYWCTSLVVLGRRSLHK
jgi:hypothetical protein